ncbi:MAG: FAD-dependent monooxygenase [Hyphomicrobiaceae bacterium]
MTDRFDILIAGAGHTGLALALALTRLGAGGRLVLVDGGGGDPVGDPRAYALSAASKRLLDRLGIWRRLTGVAQQVTRIEITDSRLDDAVRPVLLTYDNHLDDGEPGSWIVPGDALLAALRAEARSIPTEIARTEGRIAALSHDGTAASVTLEDGRVLGAALVAAADGRRSTVRRLAGIRTVAHSHDQVGIVTTVDLERPHQGIAVQHFLPAGPFAILPLPGDRACITWSEHSGEASRIMALDDVGFTAEIALRFSGRLGAAQPVGRRGAFPLSTELARDLVADRVALVGDAAHGVHPIAGQGLNLALRDVAALAECVVDGMMNGLDAGDADALARYARWRRFDATQSAAGFATLNALFSSDRTMLRTARDLGLGVVDRLPAVKRLLVAEASGTTGTLPRLMAS